MKIDRWFTVGLLAGLCRCQVNNDMFPFLPPQPGFRRSSCPILNSLANHGFLPRDGLNISREQVLDAMQKGLGFNTTGPLESTTARGLTMSSTGDNNTMHLDDIDKHNVIEHDASLSRADLGVGDPRPFNPTIWATSLVFWPDQAININQMARAFAQRMTAAAASNPRFSLSEAQEAVAINALSNVMLMFGDGTVNTTANKLWVRVLFEQERLPFAEGWRQPEQPLQPAVTAELNKRFKAAMPEQRLGCPATPPSMPVSAPP
ncbi:hypothetical protein MCOR27_005239 [Pyricularia oryzae]|nr:hypothetical protein MCOR01_000262 [Pyricularia oryzae]KAI6255205.1 hypothetical protein MCOR19_008282 [Pyricularia oryzae]KAI6279235.1 hypothetical protein MCOR27_005239 [Pyricularia oryzae]KAI6330182.1 hypothetical protein MCOR29_001956 [Pyricularia oryzae]KAI6344348.1 hypothetical protein MCOR30_001171 [Pyricularia oryzae]